MEKFINEILGHELIIIMRVNDIFTLSCNGNANIIKDGNLVIGDKEFLFTVSDLYDFTKEDDTWIINITENVQLYISILDNIR